VVIYAIDGILAELDHDVLLEVVLSRGVFLAGNLIFALEEENLDAI